MATVIWSPRALRRLGEIWFFIAAGSETNADSVSERISQAALSLSDFPEAGRMVPEFERRDIREILVRPYRLGSVDISPSFPRRRESIDF